MLTVYQKKEKPRIFMDYFCVLKQNSYYFRYII
jgi:hypothetical protein